MLDNFLKISLRSLVKRKAYTFINIFGLSMGLAGCGLIGLYIFDEWRVDRFHQKGNRLYRVTTDVVTKTGETSVNATVDRHWHPPLPPRCPTWKKSFRCAS